MQLEEVGFDVTARWLHSPAPLGPQDLANPREAAHLATMDLADVRRADICVAFTEPPEEGHRGRGGRHTELGIALALGLRVLLVGPREHVFHCLPTVLQFDSWPDARVHLEGMGECASGDAPPSVHSALRATA